MSFSALAVSQMMALAVVTGAVIIGLYLLKPPPGRVIVSSTLLWRRVIKDRKSSSDRLRWWLSLLLALSIGLLMALALGRPELNGRSGDSRRVAVVIDNSPTMAVRCSDGRTRWDHGVAEVLRILMQGSGGHEFLVADTAGQVVAPGFGTREDARTTLGALQIAATETQSFPQLLLDDAKLYFVTDGVMVDSSTVPEEAEVVSVFEPAPNVGITRFEIKPVPAHPARYEGFLEILNGGRQARDVNVLVSGAGDRRLRDRLRVAAGGTEVLILDLDDFSGGVVRAAVTALGDSLDVDNYAYAYLPIHRKLRVVLVTGDNVFLESFFHPRVDLFKLSPDGFREIPAADIYVMDGFAPDEPPDRPCLYIHPPRLSWLPHEAGEVEAPLVRFWDSEHPVLQSVALEDLVVGRAQPVRAERAQTLVASEAEALVLAGESPERWLLVTFALEESNFPLMAGFPIFLSNAMTWLAGEPTAASRKVGLVEVPGVDSRVTTLVGDDVPTREIVGSRFFEALTPGAYAVTHGAHKSYVTVNLTTPLVSRVNATLYPAGSGSRQRLIVSEVSRSRWNGELWLFLLGMAIGLLALEWWTYNQRLTT